MSGHGRQTLMNACADFLVASQGASTRPRALVIIGESGMGTSTMLDLVHAELLERGEFSTFVVDDVDEIDQESLLELLDPLRADIGTRVLIAGRELPSGIRKLLDRSFDRRIVELPKLDDAPCRLLLQQLGVMPWSMHAMVALREAHGNPRRLVDRAFSDIDVSAAWPDHDMSFQPIGAIDAAVCRFYLDLFAGVDMSTWGDAPVQLDSEGDVADALAAATALLFAGEHESALQLAERIVLAIGDADAPAHRRARLMASTLASGVRGFRGEPIGMLSLHAIAGAANRDGDRLSEILAWRMVFVCSGVRGDMTIARRALERAILLADGAGLVAIAAWFRGMLAEWHVLNGEDQVAEHYLTEVIDLARSREIPYLVQFCGPTLARSLLARGEIDTARVISEESLAMMAGRAPQGMHIDMQVTAARIRCASNDIEGALEILGAVDACLDGARQDGQHFWLVIEAVRIAAPVENGVPIEVVESWAAALGAWGTDVFGGALSAARLEVDAWLALRSGSIAGAARLASRAEVAWNDAGCGEEVEFTRRLTELGTGTTRLRGAGLLHAATDRESHAPNAHDVEDEPIRDPAVFGLLTPREREIARYVAGGMTNPEIAGELHLSPRTVEHHVASILRKLELPSRRALVLGNV